MQQIVSGWKVLFWLWMCVPVMWAQESGDAGEGEEQAGEKKVFQLYEEVVVVEELNRDVEVPNMSVVKPAFFPLGIGTTVDVALERQAGVDVQRIQEVGTAVDDDSIKIRGFGARRIALAWDGRLLNTSGVAGGYFIDWTLVPLHGVDRIEVIKGVGDPRTGNVLGGVVNLVPKRISSDDPETELQLGLGRYETWNANVFHGRRVGSFTYSLSGGWATSDGYLLNGDVESENANVRLIQRLPRDIKLTGDIGYVRLNKGFIVSNRTSADVTDPDFDVPIDPGFPASDGEYMYGGMGAYPEPGSWWEKEKVQLTLGLEQHLLNGVTWHVRGWLNHGDRESYNTRVSMNRVFHKKFYDDRSHGWSTGLRWSVGRHRLEAGLEGSRLGDDGDTNYADDFRTPFRNGYYVATKRLDGYVMDEISFAADRLIWTAGIRYMSYDGVSGPGGQIENIPDISMDGWAPSMKLTYRPDDDTLGYVSMARALRMPTPPEHYWHYDADDAGVDTSALPFSEEDGLLIQAGWQAKVGDRTNWEISPYFYDIDDYIQFDLINFVAYNIDSARFWGVETELTHAFSDRWSMFANYTFQESETKGDAFVDEFVDTGTAEFSEVPGLPKHKANAGVRMKSPAGWSVALFVQASSDQDVIYNGNRLWTDTLVVVNQDGFVTCDIEAKIPLTGRFALALYGRNLFDEVYQERFGFPAAERTLGVSVKGDF